MSVDETLSSGLTKQGSGFKTKTEDDANLDILNSLLHGDNYLINGDQRIDQRGASSAIAITNATSDYGVDRWVGSSTQNGYLTMQQVEDAPTDSGFKFSTQIKQINATPATVGGTNIAYYAQRIEGLNCIDLELGTTGAKTVTLSFWIKGTVAGTYSGSLGNSAQNRMYPFEFPVTTAWVKQSITIDLDITGTWLTTKGIGLTVYFDIGSGGSRKDTANVWTANPRFGTTGSVALTEQVQNSTLNFTGIKLQQGSKATPWRNLDMAIEFAKCRRYYRRWLGSTDGDYYPFEGQISTTVLAYFLINTHDMRSPNDAIADDSGDTDFKVHHLELNRDSTSIGAYNVTDSSVRMSINNTSANFVAGSSCLLRSSAANSWVEVDNEL